MNRLTILFSIAGLVVMAATFHTETREANYAPGDPIFIGAAKCKTCHRKVEQGEQFRLWQESAHAQAWTVLASEEATAIAQEKGIENPQEADACLRCHVTGHGAAAELLGPKYSVEDGVGCESCHGAGGDYYKKKVMQSIADGETEGASVGLLAPTEETCVGCHNQESPTFTAFDFEEAKATIAHPVPEITEP